MPAGNTTDRPQTPFGRWLKGQLADRDMTHSDLAAALGVARPRVSEWIYRVNPQPDRILGIATALAVPVETVVRALAGRPPDPGPPSPLAREVALLAADTPDALLLPVALALRSLQRPGARAAALRDIAAATP